MSTDNVQPPAPPRSSLRLADRDERIEQVKPNL
ncbi:MAG: hypothetical protein QOE47_1834, partial [Pyrinomonadaceae bacterium]|nr:hypothetical protein [Pyrinomonadaceae bacterium]